MKPSIFKRVTVTITLLVCLLDGTNGQQNTFQVGSRERDRDRDRLPQQFPSSSNINIGSSSSSSNLLDPFSRRPSGFGGDANNVIFEEPYAIDLTEYCYY